MAQGIVVKIWNITEGSQGRSGSAQIADSLAYIENLEKVGGSMSMGGVSQVTRELTYVTNALKTLEGLYVGSRHITDISHATEEMMQVKEFYGKTDGRQVLHGVVSLDAEESDPNNAGKLMLLLNEFMEQIFPQNQVVYAVHTNTDNLHIHFVVNTVGLDGKKIHMDNHFMRQEFEPALNKLAVKYGFTPNANWKRVPEKDEIPLEQRKMILRRLIDHAIGETDDFSSFIAYLRADGLTVNVGKNITLQMDGMPYAIRSGQLGSIYTPEGITRRIANKYDSLLWKSVGEHSHYLSEKEMINFIPQKMKKYKDMTAEEKSNAIRLIRLKRNPWEEQYRDNWAIQKMAKELNRTAYVYELVHYYSNGLDDVEEAMKKIVKQKKAISEERKAVRAVLKEYKPITDLYEEMKKYMERAYLFDAYGKTEYVSDFMKYKELSEQMELYYGKSVEEVADFIVEHRQQLMYAKEQEKELSTQYMAIKKYVEGGRFRTEEAVLSFVDAVGFWDAINQAKDYGVYVSEVKYITSKDVKGLVAQVMTTPDMKDGKPTISTTVTIKNSDGKIIREITSKDKENAAFSKELKELEREYGFTECSVSKKKAKGVSL